MILRLRRSVYGISPCWLACVAASSRLADPVLPQMLLTWRTCLEGFEGGANVAKAASSAIKHEFTTTPDGSASLTGRLTAFVGNITMAHVEDSQVLASRQLDMGNVG